MKFVVEIEQEVDGRWIADIPQILGAIAYGSTRRRGCRASRSFGIARLCPDGLRRGERVLAERITTG